MISRRALLSQFGLIAAAGGGAWWLRHAVIWPDPAIAFPAGGKGGWLAFAMAGQGMPIVEGRIGSKPVEVLVDSGAQSSVVDRALATALGLKTAVFGPLVLAQGLSGSSRLGRTAQFDLSLGGLKLNGLRAAMFDLAPIADASGRSFRVILGQDVLRLLIADFDFPGARLAFAAPAGYAPPAGIRPFPVRRNRRELLAQVTVESVSLEAMIDTGSANLLSLAETAARAAGLFDGRPASYAPSVTFGGMGRDRVAFAREVGFAGQTWRRTPVRVHSGASGLPQPAGLLGVGALERFRMVMDVGGGRLFLS